jgi:hypothetical protein
LTRMAVCLLPYLIWRFHPQSFSVGKMYVYLM